ncbi:hypothetical protein PYW07_008737 [Mythimna separata]|uniref:Nuclear pore complex protein Nup88 n=1 Tax=Mythimna separata TaxID=271217 RepID=A0AAD8DN53_MYTSE|nr:hypothetical protein PYW07_008737 [Mythimna separata]
MDSRLYETKLPNHKIFKELKDSLSENPSGKLRNLVELKDDVFYVWNSKENCLLSLNLKHLEESGDETPYQKLLFLIPPAFHVERIMTSGCGSRICVWGSRGVTIAELPARWGRSGLFDSGKDAVLCKSYSLDERFLYCQGEVRRVHWHPGSLSHVFVLGSDNTIRLYNIALKKGPKLVQTLSIGIKPSGQLAGRNILDSLGDTAVDFTPIPDSETLLILRGNGDVYMMRCELEKKSPLTPKLSGPLAMYPPADDNYGSESCSITALGGGDTPPLVVVATCSAALYHCLLLPNPSEKEDGDSHALYVVEAVELNIVLNPDDDLQYSYPVHLYPVSDLTSEKEDGDSHALYVVEAVELNIVLNPDDDLQYSYPVHLYPVSDLTSEKEDGDSHALYVVEAVELNIVLNPDDDLQYSYPVHLYPVSDLTSEKEDALYVVEAVELNIVLNPDDDLQYSYPLHLYPCTNNTYACVHAGGVHAITLPMLGHLVDYALADETEMEAVLSAMCSRSSVARHLVCTGTGAALAPPVGLALTSPPLPKLLVLCAESNLVARTLEPFDLEEQLYKELQLKNPTLEQDDINNILKERQKLTFTSIVQEILTRDVSQPILQISKKAEPSPRECLEFLTQATLKLRGEYISRQQRVSDAIARKLHSLRSLSNQHQEWLQDLQKEIDDVQLDSTVLKEKCMLAEKHQDDLKYRCSAVIRKIRASASASPAERELLAELERYKRCGERLGDQILMLKQHAQHKTEELEKWHSEYKKTDIALGKSHSDTISSILQQQTGQISLLIEETKLLKDQLSIV